jgi:NAD kinase
MKMRFQVVGRNISGNIALRKTLLRLGFKTGNKPDMIICLGGDGTFLYNERKFPGIPKLLIRDSEICKKCENRQLDELFKKIGIGKYTIHDYSKLEAMHRGKKLVATNDFVVRNRTPTQAIRFEVAVDGKKLGIMIGDGIVVSSVFGSTGYHYSITKKSFDEGIGLAFNNITGKERSILLPANAKVSITLIRHYAHLGHDNSPDLMTIREGETVIIRNSKSVARIVRVN